MIAPFGPLWWLSILPGVAILAFLVWRYVVALRAAPAFTKDRVVYQEFFASGASQKNILTKLGGARNCLRLVVTHEFLWITSWFPLSLIAVIYDLEHVVPLQNIQSAERVRTFGFESLSLKFTDARGTLREVRLFPRDLDKFVRALRVES
ncbi:MAG: hypothetical protein QM775_29975 [Pirellulales bacterium]